MNLFKAISPSSPRFQEIEFSLLLGWALLFPEKIGYFYYFGFMCLLAAFTLGKASALKNIAVTRFSYLLLLFNAVLIFGAFFSPHPYRSLLFVADFLLVSLWFTFFYLEKEDTERYLALATLVISLSSLGMVILFALQKGRGPVTPFFENPNLQSIASALAALVFLQAMIRKYGHAELLLLALNAGAVVISASKVVLLGLTVFVLVIVVRNKRRWLYFLLPVLLVLPLWFLDVRSSDEDSHALTRLETWSISAHMFHHHPWVGVGPDLFEEAAPRFIFPMKNDLARYGKVANSPQSDYWKIISENGLFGLTLVLLFLFFVIRRLLSPSGPDPAPWLLAFLLTQMLLFNFLFHFFFLIILLFLLRDFFSSGRSFVSLRPAVRVFVSGLLAFVLLTLYLLPFLANRCLEHAAGERDPLRRFALLRQASLLSPLDDRAPLAKARMLRDFIRSRSAPALKAPVEGTAWAEALENVRRAQRLNRNSIDALILESELFQCVQFRGHCYPAQGEEILEPLRRAEKLAPFNPFLKLQQAVILWKFGHIKEARSQATTALDLEPDYVAAIMFIHGLNGLPADDPALHERLTRIREKADHLKARPGSYLFKLHQLPAAAQGQGSAAMPSPRR